jgi:DNA-binding NarL/FixJ family response regulator
MKRAPAKAKLRILLVDDHPIVREGLRTLLQTQPEITVVGEAEDASAGLALAAQLRPDIVIMDLSMPGMNGLEATGILTKAQPETKVLILTFFEDETYMEQAAAAGACGFITKRAAPNHLIDALRRVAAGKTAFGSNPDGRMSRAALRREGGRPPSPQMDLSGEDLRIALLTAEGRTRGEIAAALEMDSSAVHARLSEIMRNLGVRSRAELARLVHKRGLS